MRRQIYISVNSNSQAIRPNLFIEAILWINTKQNIGRVIELGRSFASFPLPYLRDYQLNTATKLISRYFELATIAHRKGTYHTT